MHSSFNQRIGNKENTTGNVADYMARWRHLIQKNDGTRSFILRTTDCHDQSAPFTENQETRISITHADHDISQISEGFLTFKVRLTLQLPGLSEIQDDNFHLLKLFVGFKSSNQILDQLQINNRNRSTGYQQNECCREGFAYSAIKPQAEKKTKKFIHSLYENVANYSPSVCGTYINVAELADGKPHDVEFDLNLPFDDILALQAFDEFPNFAAGDLELKFYVKPAGLVWCMVDPTIIKDYKEVLEGGQVDLDLSRHNFHALFKHAFSQINTESFIISKFITKTESINGVDINYADAELGFHTLQCLGMSIRSLKSNMYGYGITDASKRSIIEELKNPLYIPSQMLDYNAFPLAATPAGIQSTINMPLSNVSCISIMFPKHDNDLTIFENPCYDNLQLTVNGRNIPDETVNTLGARFLQYQLNASDLSGGLQCTREFEDSFIMVKNNASDGGNRYINSLSDATSFMFNAQTERNGAGYTYDGYDSNGQNVPIQLKGQPVYTGIKDTYYNVDLAGTQHPPPPQIWLCRDTFFIVSLNGVDYVRDQTPPGSQAN